jgi:hypothetical protein
MNFERMQFFYLDACLMFFDICSQHQSKKQNKKPINYPHEIVIN